MDERELLAEALAHTDWTGDRERMVRTFLSASEKRGLYVVAAHERIRLDIMRRICTVVYDGVPGGSAGIQDDAGRLEAFAAWLDLIDDAADVALASSPQIRFEDRRVGRTMQEDLRRIAQWMRRINEAGESLLGEVATTTEVAWRPEWQRVSIKALRRLQEALGGPPAEQG